MIQRAPDKPAAIYLRRSTDRQLQSIPDQRTAVKRYAAERGFSLVAEYVDDAVSGTSVDGRRDFKRLLHDALSPEPSFRTVIVYEISRFSRDEPMRAMSLLNELAEHGIEILSVSDPLPGGDFDCMFMSFKQTLAHMEVKDTSRRTIRGQVSRARTGCWMGGTPPFGYDLGYLDSRGVVHAIVRFMETGEKQVLDPNGCLDRVLGKGERQPRADADRTTLVLSVEARRQIVQRIFRLRVDERLGYRSIAERLNAEGVPSPRNGNYSRTAREGWSRSTIKALWRTRPTQVTLSGTAVRGAYSIGSQTVRPSRVNAATRKLWSETIQPTTRLFAMRTRQSSIARPSRVPRISPRRGVFPPGPRRIGPVEPRPRPTSAAGRSSALAADTRTSARASTRGRSASTGPR
ncbi:MAG TPA: recombinase family protein [Candidatus Krumholzibacteria bacterium]|nr:recombinase family protein [Candidatus Krumholzibacteria bacterium]